MTRLSIHQPETYPWLGYFNKIMSSDVFVILDHVNFSKGSFQNRNRIASGGQAFYLTIPVPSKSNRLPINQVEVNHSFIGKHLKSIAQAYAKAPYKESLDDFLSFLEGRSTRSLSDFNCQVIDYLNGLFDIKTEVVLSSELSVEGCKSDLVLNICQHFNADVYLSGKLGVEYLDRDSFNEQNIGIQTPTIADTYLSYGLNEKVSNLSVLDVIASVGIPETKNIIKRFYLWKEF